MGDLSHNELQKKISPENSFIFFPLALLNCIMYTKYQRGRHIKMVIFCLFRLRANPERKRGGGRNASDPLSHPRNDFFIS